MYQLLFPLSSETILRRLILSQKYRGILSSDVGNYNAAFIRGLHISACKRLIRDSPESLADDSDQASDSCKLVSTQYHRSCCVLRQQIVESRQRLQQRRQSIVAGRRGSIGSLSSSPPPVNRHGASSPASTPRPSARTPKSPDVSSSQTCTVQ